MAGDLIRYRVRASVIFDHHPDHILEPEERLFAALSDLSDLFEGNFTVVIDDVDRED